MFLHPRPVLCWALLLLSLRPIQEVHGQRAIVNLGKRIFDRRGGSSAGPAAQALKGENKNKKKLQQEGLGEEISSSTASPPPMTYWVAVVATVLALVYLPGWLEQRKRAKQRENDDDASSTEEEVQDDFIVQNGGPHKMEGSDHVDLAFEDIQLTLTTKKKARLLLDGSCRGRAKPGRMLAIMGPSGAGKSTLLHALAGRVKDSPKLRLQGLRYVNGHPVCEDCMLPAAFIEQEAVFFPHMTVRETLNFRVELKLGKQSSKAVRDELVDELMEQVGLSKSADTIVGDNKVRGISGGERKRLSIAVEMISSPSLVFLDEPTSGTWILLSVASLV